MLFPTIQKALDFNEIKGFSRWPTRTRTYMLLNAYDYI